MEFFKCNKKNGCFQVFKSNVLFFPGLIALIFLFSSCNTYKSDVFKAVVNDSLHLISPATKSWLESNNYPKGFPLYVQSVDSVPNIKIGVAADDAFEESIEKFGVPKAFKKRGILLFITKNPNLIQVRVGKDIRLLCQWAKLTAGEQYMAYQKRFMNEPDSAIKELITWLTITIPEKTDIPWYKKIIYNEATSGMLNEIDDYNLPSESFYGETIIKPTLELRIFEWNLFKGWWLTYILVAFLAYLLKQLLGLIFKKLYSEHKSKTYKIVLSIIRFLVIVFVNLFIIVPSVATAFLLSGARIEDQLALKATNLPGAESVLFTSNTFYGPTGIWTALLVLVIIIVGKKAMDYDILKFALYPKEIQVKIYKNLQEADPVAAFFLMLKGTRPGKTIETPIEDFEADPYNTAYGMSFIDIIQRAVLMALLCWVFLPLYITCAIIFYYTPQIIIGGYKTIMVLIKHKNPPQ